MKSGFFALLISGIAAFPAFAAEKPVFEIFTLKNGLEVIVVPNHRVPAVNHTLWYKIGAADDPVGKSGLAHYHEHVMFLGTQKYKKGEYVDIISRNGGQQNAFTGHDATAYYINIAKEHLPLAMEMEADRMKGLAASDEDLNKEREVIIEERRQRTDNNPDAQLAEQADAALFRNHPYRIPVIGWKNDMEKLTGKDVIEFHEKYYHPNNAILIIGGDVEPGEVKKLAEKYYGDLQRVEVPERKWNEEPPQIAQRRIVMHSEQVTHPEFSKIYATSSLGYGKKEDALPLFVLAQVLGGGKASRLYSSLITKQKLAAEINVNYSGFNKGIGKFSINAVPEQAVAPEKLEAAINKELTDFLKTGISAEELARAKTLLKAETIFMRDGLSGVAHIMGWIRMIGLDGDYFIRFPELVDEVSIEQVLTAAQNTLKDEQSVVTILLPQEEKK